MRVHSLLSPKCRVADSTISGQGVYAAEPFEEGELVAVWGGKVYTEDEALRLAEVLPHFGTHTIGLCMGYVLGSPDLFELDDAELFNHGCDPNTGVRGQVLLVTRRAVVAGEELTFDYETVDTNPGGFSCRCGAARCRKTIDGSAWKNEAFRRAHHGFLSTYIEQRIAGE